MHRFILSAALLPAAVLLLPAAAPAAAGPDDEHYHLGRQAIARGIEYLRTQQNEETGGWGEPQLGMSLPGVTALVIAGMLMDHDINESDPQVARGIDYLLSLRKHDGGIHDGLLENYNTSLALSALSRVNRPEAREAIKAAQDYLRSLQWDGQTDAHGRVVDESHPFYGGAGYGRHGRPDNSNLQIMLQALHDSGLDCDDPAFQRAVTFLQRTQMHEDVNDMPYAQGSRQGGFIYSTSVNKDEVGVGQSFAGEIEEHGLPGRADGLEGHAPGGHPTVSRLRAYGSMTYAGFKSYLYAEFDRDDPRVTLAWDWIRRHYTVEENPGVGMQGYYYYLVTFARALSAWGEPTITLLDADGTDGETRRWANDLITQLARLQRDDGSFINEHDRWMEGDPVLVTAYAVVALQHAIE